MRYKCKTCNRVLHQKVCPVCDMDANVEKAQVPYCNYCNMPVWDLNLRQKCNVCGEKISNWYKDLVPVFLEEKVLLSVIFKENILDKSVWSLGRNMYLVNSERKILKSDELKDKEGIIKKYKNVLENIDKQTLIEKEAKNIELFVNANKNRFMEIETESHNYVKQVYIENQDRIPIISFSGGKDSITISDIVRQALSRNDIIHIFGNTTLEMEETIEFINEFRRTNPRIPFIEAKSNKNFIKLCEEIGPPTRMVSWCSSIFKSGPISQVLNSFNYDKKTENCKKFLTFYGIRGEESVSRDRYGRTSNSPKITSQKVASPIFGWLDFDVWLYILSRQLKFNKAYKKGYRRVGCWCCPNNSKWSETLNSIYINDKQSIWQEFLYSFAKKAGKKDYKDYIDEGFWKMRHGGEGLDNSHTKVIRVDCIDENYVDFILNKSYTDKLDEYLKPFGNIQKETKNDIVWIYIYNKKSSKKLFTIKSSYGSRVIKCNIHINSNKFLLKQRIECQLRKYQICIQCSSCDSICKNGAITTLNGVYRINENKCEHCLECVAGHFVGGCLINEMLVKKKGDQNEKGAFGSKIQI